MIEDAIPSDYANINSYLDAVMQEEPVNALKDFIKRHKEFTQARHFLDNLDVVKQEQYPTNLVTKGGRFVGIEFTPGSSDNIATWIRAIGVQFTAVNNTLRLYLFNSSLIDPLASAVLTTHNRIVSLQWIDWSPNSWAMNYKSMDTGTGSRFFLGYFENDLVGQACDTHMVGNCCGNEVWYKSYQDLCRVRGVVFEPGALNGAQLPDLKKVGYTDQTFGLHVKLSITCDITDTICQNKLMFDSVVQKKVAMRIYNDFMNSNRQNRNSTISRDMAAYNMEQIGKEYIDDIKSLQFDFSGIDRYCMPCKAGGLTTSTQI